MTCRRSVVTRMSMIIAISFLAFPLGVSAADTPMAIIQGTVQKTLTVLQNPVYQGSSHRQERLSQVAATILSHFDTEGLSRRVLGSYWRQLTVNEQQEFVRLFTALVEHTYGAVIDRYAQDVQVFYDQQRVDGVYAEVDTRVRDSSANRSLSINYFLRQVNGQWLIYDVQIDNVSMVLNYRSQFAHILRTASYPALVQRLKSKLLELGVTPS
jgi:phospholipid transport system substrate-binding protein